MTPHGFRHAPPWWPDNEPWPPRGRPFGRHPARARFVRWAGLVFGVVLLLSAIGGLTVASWVVEGLGGARLATPGLAPVGLAGLALAALAFWGAARRFGTPVGDLVAAAHRVADGDYAVRVTAAGPPFVRVIANAFNDMAGRLARQEEQRRAVMADLAHELRTPLAVAQGRLEGMLDGVYPMDRGAVEPLLAELRTLTRLVEDLRLLANAESGALVIEREPTDVGALMHDAVEAVRDEALGARVQIAVEDETDGQAFSLDPVRIRQVIVNLLTNAIRHGGPDQVVRLRARVDDGALVVALTDEGPGIADEDLAQLFTRFYRGRDSRGTGLGLTIARNLVRAHGGDVTATRGATRGLTVTFTLPIR